MSKIKVLSLCISFILIVTLISGCNTQQTNDVKTGYTYQEIQYPWNDNGISRIVTIGVALPESWDVELNKDSGSVVPFAEYAVIRNSESAVGGIGFLPYELPEGTELIPEAIFSQLTLSSASIWNIHGHFDTVTEDKSNYCTALTSVLYAGNMFPDGQERNNSAIVSYHKEFPIYIAFQIQDGTTGNMVLTDEELQYIAESIKWVINLPM